MMASTFCVAKYSAAGRMPFQAGSYPSGVRLRTPTPRGMKRTPGYMIGPSNGTSSVANGTTRPMVMFLLMTAVTPDLFQSGIPINLGKRHGYAERPQLDRFAERPETVVGKTVLAREHHDLHGVLRNHDVMSESRQAGISRPLPAQIATGGRRREDFERHDDVVAVPSLRVGRVAAHRYDQKVRFWTTRVGHSDSKSGKHFPDCSRPPFKRRQDETKIFDNSLMQLAGRSIQDRLPVDQLPFLPVRPRVGEGIEFLHRHRSSLDGRDAHGIAPCAFQPLTSTGPVPCGRSPSLMMPSRLATSV